MKRKFADRLHDMLWTEVSQRLTSPMPRIGSISSSEGCTESISGLHPWTDACNFYSSGAITSEGFRRLLPVREIVETLGPVDGKHYAGLIRSWDAEYLSSQEIKLLDSWGDPIRWPGFLLGTPYSMSPTTLRYLAHALWMKRNNLIIRGQTIVEIGVGYGGLAAMNYLVSEGRTYLVDLPQVEKTAMKMLSELELGEFPSSHQNSDLPADYCVISNYAFTELSRELQNEYFEKYIRSAPRGLIVSNANVFAKDIGGRCDHELMEWFGEEGLNAKIKTSGEIFGPSDRYFGVSFISWS